MAEEIHGHCAKGYEGVRDALAASFARGEEIGAAVAVTVDGEPVIDLWAVPSGEYLRLQTLGNCGLQKGCE